jgi:hydrogenase expression/formation protein HypE
VNPKNPDFSCPLPHRDSERIEIAHGGGGQRMHELLTKTVFPRFDNPLLAAGTDAAVLVVGEQRLAFTTDSFVVSPAFFPGGDIGVLAVCGTLNDLATVGALPRWLSAGLIIEEGLPTVELERILDSMAATAGAAGVELVTGDTKVVERGKGDGIYINTTGIGIIEHQLTIAPAAIQRGDAILVSGDLGRHGIAVMAARDGMIDSVPVESDVALIHPCVNALVDAGIEVHCVRDLTRGGLVSAMVEIAGQAAVDLLLREAAIPVSEPVRWACELLGFDPLYVANEGRFAAFVPHGQAEQALAVLRASNSELTPAIIGTVSGSGQRALIESRYGPVRRLAMISGEQMPRIC